MQPIHVDEHILAAVIRRANAKLRERDTMRPGIFLLSTADTICGRFCRPDDRPPKRPAPPFARGEKPPLFFSLNCFVIFSILHCLIHCGPCPAERR